MVGTWNLGVAFQDRVASVVGRDQRVGNAVVLSFRVCVWPTESGECSSEQ